MFLISGTARTARAAPGGFVDHVLSRRTGRQPDFERGFLVPGPLPEENAGDYAGGIMIHQKVECPSDTAFRETLAALSMWY